MNLLCSRRWWIALSRLYLLLSRSLELQSRARPLVEEDERDIQTTVFDINRYFTSLALLWWYRQASLGFKKSPSRWYICVFLGTKVPHLLHQITEGRYKLIGACCIPDCMNGEVLEADNLAVEEFVIV
jgi:hypothetical protein